jgi:hypothetical protein
MLASTRHLWIGDQSGASDSLRDLCDPPMDLVDFSAPAVCNAWGAAGGRVLDGTADYFATADSGLLDSAAMLYAYVSTTITFRLGATFSAAGCLLSYGADTADYAYSWDVGIDANRNIVLRYGNGAAWITNTFTTPTLRLGRRYQIRLDRDTTANTVKLYVNGGLVETKSSVTDPSVSAATLTWRVGSRYTAAAAADPMQCEVYSIRVDCSASALPTLADAREDFRRAQQWSTETACYWRAKMTDGATSPAVQNLSDFLNTDWFKGATINDDADQNMETATLDLFRDSYSASLARYHDNRANKPTDYPPAIGPTEVYTVNGDKDAIAPNREMWIECALVPLSSSPVSTDWQMMYHGKTLSVDWAKDVAVECNDLGIDLMKAYIERTVQFPQDHTDHTLLYTIQDMLTYAAAQGWIASAPTVIEPVAADGLIATWKQERAPLFPAAIGIPEQIAWLLRYRWNDAIGDFSLTLYQPDRTRTYEDAYITSDDYTVVTKFTDDNSDVRTRCRVLFASTAPGADPAAPALAADQFGGWGEDSEGNAGQFFVEVTGEDVDGTFAETGDNRQFCELAEGSGVNVTTYAQAEKWAAGVVRDLYKCTTQKAVKFRDGMPQIECEDMLYFAANGVHTTVDFLMAVYSRSISCSAGGGETTASLRGKPSGGTKRWLSREIRTSGARSGIMVKDDLEVAAASRISRQSRWSVIERSGVITSPPLAGVRNSEFQTRSAGVNYEPDGWRVLTDSAWGANVSYDTTNAKRGQYCVKVMP